MPDRTRSPRPLFRAMSALSLGLAIALGGCAQMGAFRDEPAPVAEERAQARAGDAESQYRLGMRYNGGLEVAQDYTESNRWFERAARQGHAEAQYMLGSAYYAGRGVAQDMAKAEAWLRPAAEAGHDRAQYLLGSIYLNGWGVEKEPAWGVRWFGKAAAQGNTEAQFSLGVALAAGIGLDRDDAEAWTWLTLAKRAGHSGAEPVERKVAERLHAGARARAATAARNWKPAAADGGYADRPTVRFVQYALGQLGHRAGTSDGIAGERTRAAIAGYQRAAGLAGAPEITPQLVERLRADLRARAAAG